MFRFLLGVLAGAAATATWMTWPSAAGSRARPSGRVDELSSAAQNVVSDEPLNAGDGTPERAPEAVREASVNR